MAASKSLPNTAYKSGPLLSAREEAVRFTQAADRLLERARQDPLVAEKFLRDIGYYEIMKGQPGQDTGEEVALKTATKTARPARSKKPVKARRSLPK